MLNFVTSRENNRVVFTYIKAAQTISEAVTTEVGWEKNAGVCLSDVLNLRLS